MARCTLWLTAVLFIGNAQAQDVTKCRPSDFRDTYKSDLTLRERIAIFTSFTEDDLIDAKKHLDASGKYPVTPEFVIQGTTNWEDITKQKRSMATTYKFDSDYAISSDVYQSYLSPLYSECLASLKAHGLRAWIEKGSPGSTEVTLRVTYLAPEEVNQNRKFVLQMIDNVEFDSARNPPSLHPSFKGIADQLFVLQRGDVDKASRIIIYAQNTVTKQFPAPITITIPPRPRLLKNEPIIRTIDSKSQFQSRNSHDDEHHWCVAPDVKAGFKFDPSKPAIVDFVEMTGDVDHANGSLVSQSEMQICAHGKVFAAHGLDAGGFGRITTTEVLDPHWIDITNKVSEAAIKYEN